MNLESLRSLQKRIREAKGADRKLDAEIAIALGLVSGAPWEIFTDRLGERTARNSMSGTEVLLRDFGRYLKLPKLTSDPDGLGPCVALLEAVFPGALWSVWNMEHGPGARILCPGKSGAFHDGQYAEVDELSDWTPASVCHALIDCAVSALIAQEEAKEKADA